MTKTNITKIFICFSFIFTIGKYHTLTAQHSFYAGGNFNIAPFDNLIEVDQNVVDPVYPDILRYQIKPTITFKLGYTYGLQIVKKLKINAGLELNQRRYSFDFFYDSIPINYPYYIYSNVNNTYYNLEIPLSLTFPLEKIRISGGVNMILLNLRYRKDYTNEGLVSKRSYFGFFPRLESAHFIYPFIKLDYHIHKSSDLSYYVSSVVELREYLGRTISISFFVELL